MQVHAKSQARSHFSLEPGQLLFLPLCRASKNSLTSSGPWKGLLDDSAIFWCKNWDTRSIIMQKGNQIGFPWSSKNSNKKWAQILQIQVWENLTFIYTVNLGTKATFIRSACRWMEIWEGLVYSYRERKAMISSIRELFKESVFRKQATLRPKKGAH